MRDKVEWSRQEVAQVIGADDPQQIIFTSGATEANNSLLHLPQELWVSPFEHSSIRELSSKVLSNKGWEIEAGPMQGTVSVMAVNNETGAILTHPLSGNHNHSDLTQLVGKKQVTLQGLQSASFSGHKFGGPMGVGVLYLEDPSSFPALQRGGEQEFGLRAGTLNGPGIVGLGVAAAIVRQKNLDQEEERVRELRQIVKETLLPVGPHYNESENQSPWILSIAIPGVLAETLVIEADVRGYAISSGAACSSGSTEPSHVLMALGLPLDLIRSTIRISFGPSNTKESASGLAQCLVDSTKRLTKP
jgi:cysteine desulfurase